MVSKYGASVAEGRPDLIEQWSPKNNRSPYEVKPGSQMKVSWVGTCGHEWIAPVDNRVYSNTGCPFCTDRGGKKLKKGVNDLGTVNPELAKEWHPTRNGGITPSDTLPAVKVRYWWLCSTCGREWAALLNMRHSKGTGCPSCRGRKRGVKVSGSDHWGRLREEWSKEDTLTLDDYSVSSQVKARWVCKNGHRWKATIGDRNLKKTECKQCGFGGTSRGEVEVRNFISGLGVEVRAHHRQIDPQFEFDITAPEKGVAVEYNGIYWHSEDKKGQLYHLNKLVAAEREGWKLLHIWEDDWRDRREVVKEMIRRKLGVSQQEKVNARDLTPHPVSTGEAKEFMVDNHIQGFTGGSKRIGLFTSTGNLVALAILRSRGRGRWDLVRYATNRIVRGGFSKILSVLKADSEIQEIVTFADRGVSDGGLYEAHGFIRDGELPPDYSYVRKNTREHKFNYRKSRFKKDPNLKYQEGLTERELADLNGMLRIYDAGKVRWVKKMKPECGKLD